MAMKQTQTKMFDFSDVGLDFCAGSKNKFPEVFKKMLATGFNTQTVSSVSITGNQVTLTYGMNHGYVAGRVLQLNAVNLSGEFIIDSVTSNTVKLTIDQPLGTVAGGFSTYVAPLGMQLVYEQANIHVYKFKSLDESDLYLRLCFQTNAMQRNVVAPCIGKTIDINTGFITDIYALADTKTRLTALPNNNWGFTYAAEATYNDSTYGAGLSLYGKGCVVGSLYHLLFLYSSSNSGGGGRISGFLPTSCLNYAQLNYPCLLVEDDTRALTSNGDAYGLPRLRAYVGNIKAMGDPIRSASSATTSYFPTTPRAYSSFTSLDAFNTTCAEPMRLYEFNTDQFIGFTMGMYVCAYDATNTPPVTRDLTPSVSSDIDLNSKIMIHPVFRASQQQDAIFFAIPIEEIKIGT
ncbi:hypothetical protein [Acinetobacter sp. ANC 4648]|uniref:hypothetical protein n=1 Tax=Acinetobacter sp. ANC 4648 TaxID=1977875 RepID=UPI000A355AE0|nr:hypothetical protein [Acinetobacter sp. ANC 4648]OTG82161.1 hypothetical protein B9T27_07870 [Acinetobacter sp. ANC 4648]